MLRLLSFILLSLVIFGCGQADENTPSPSAIVVEKSFIGSVKINSDYISGIDASHILMTDANSKIYLKSFLHNLNEYIDSRVRVSGSFIETDFANKSISQLEVSSIDMLEKVSVEEDAQTFEKVDFNKIGLSLNLPDKLQFKENDKSVFFSFGNSNFTITPTLLDSDYNNYLENYSQYPSDLLRVDKYNFNLFLLSDYEHLYTLDLNGFVLEIKVSLFDNSLQSKIDLLLENLEVDMLEDSVFNIEFSELIEEELENTQEEMIDENSNIKSNDEVEANAKKDVDSTEYASSLKIDSSPVIQAVSSNTVDEIPQTLSPFDSEIKRFELSANAILSDLSSVTRYYFAESQHFYVEYVDTEGTNKRALISYANNLNVVARFVEDEVMDWRLVTGQNLVYDQKLTLVDSSGNSHNLKEGFRLFESLPLEFSLQYPMQMYYMRNDDTYIFADDPNLKEVAFTISKITNFDKLKYNKTSSNLYFNGIDYIIELNGVLLQLSNKSLPVDVLNYILSTVSILTL